MQGQTDFGCLSWLLNPPKIQLTGPHSLPLTEQTWADLCQTSTELFCNKVKWLWGSETAKKKSPLKCSTLKPLKHVFLKLPCHLLLIYPLIPSSVVLTPPESVGGSAGLRFPNLSSAPPTPHPFSPVLGPLCHGNPLFPLRPTTHAHTHEHRWSESVCCSRHNIYLTMIAFCWRAVWQIKRVSGDISE